MEEVKRKGKVQGINRGPSSDVLNVNLEIEFPAPEQKDPRRYGCNLVISKQDAKALNLQIDDEIEISLRSK